MQKRFFIEKHEAWMVCTKAFGILRKNILFGYKAGGWLSKTEMIQLSVKTRTTFYGWYHVCIRCEFFLDAKWWESMPRSAFSSRVFFLLLADWVSDEETKALTFCLYFPLWGFDWILYSGLFLVCERHTVEILALCIQSKQLKNSPASARFPLGWLCSNAKRTGKNAAKWIAWVLYF